MSPIFTGNPTDPCIQIIPTLGPKVCKYYLHWAIWIPRETFTVSGMVNRDVGFVLSHPSPLGYAEAQWNLWFVAMGTVNTNL